MTEAIPLPDGVQCLVTADAVPAMRISGIFKQGALIGDGSDRDPLQLLA